MPCACRSKRKRRATARVTSFGEPVAQGGAALIAPVAGINHSEIAYWRKR